jgi:AraC-type DNA-binding domain-containing proteins
MDWRQGMNRAIEYIEENIAGNIHIETAARYAGCSKWEFYRIFSFVTHISLGEYIRKRKLALALRDLQSCDEKIIDIAVKYDYDSPAAFSRAFHQTYGVSPSLARKDGVQLAPYPRLIFTSYDKEHPAMKKPNNMEAYSQRGYYVKENAPVYFTKDIKKTCDWFQDILGWYGDIIMDDDGNVASYSCVFDYPGELIVSGLTPFRGIHLFKGEPIQGVVGFIMVQGVEKLHKLVKDNGWTQISDIEPQPWGANECRATTIDGSILRFFETT